MSELNIGDTVCISGDHPHAGRSGKIEGAYRILGKAALRIDFPDGDGCFVFADGKAALVKVKIGR